MRRRKKGNRNHDSNLNGWSHGRSAAYRLESRWSPPLENSRQRKRFRETVQETELQKPTHPAPSQIQPFLM